MNNKEEEEGRREKEERGEEDRMPLRCSLQRLYFSTQRRSKGLKDAKGEGRERF